MAEPHVIAIGPVLHDLPTENASAYIPGSLVYYEEAVWKLADADGVTTYAQGICLDYKPAASILGAGRISVAFEALIEDIDAPYTAGTQYYLSSTPGQYTTTRPVSLTTSRLAQVVGMARSTSVLHFKINPPTEVHDYQPFVASNLGAEAYMTLDSGVFHPPYDLNADNDKVALTVRVPDSAIGLAIAVMHWGLEAIAGGTRTWAIRVASALSGMQHDNVTADTSVTAQAASAGTAADDITGADISAAFDAVDIIRPGALLSVEVNSDLSAGTDSGGAFGVEFVWRVVS